MLLRYTDAREFVDADGRSIEPGVLSDLPCTLLLSSSLASIAELAVGAGEAALLRKTLPWRLEENLIKAPDLLHFSHGTVHEGRVAITVSDKQALAQILAAAGAAGINLQAAYAELSLVPWQTQQWSLWMQDQQVLVRHGWHQGFACQRDNLVSALSLLQNEQQAWPHEIVFFGSQEQAALIQRQLPVPLRSLLVLRRPPPWAELFATAKVAGNVLQGSFAPALPWRSWWKNWRVAACLLAALVLGDAALTGANTWHLRSARASLQQQMMQEFRQVQPQGAVVDPLMQLRQLLAANGGSGQHLLPLLTQMAPVLQSESGSVVQALDFDAASGSLQLELRSNGFIAVESLRNKLQKAGLTVELVGSSSDGQSSQARLRVGAL